MIPLTDNDGRLRQAAFALLLNSNGPVAELDLAKATALESDVVRSALERLARLGWIDRADDGRVTGAEGLSLTTGPHRLRLETGSFQTWCAYDAIGIAAALRADATIDTPCAVCGQPLTLVLRAGAPAASRPERLWLADGGSDLRADFCTPTVLLCSVEHAAAWAVANHEHGKALTLEEAATLGRAAWAPSAHLARTLRA